MGKVLLAGVEPYERPPPGGAGIADRAEEGGEALLKGVDDPAGGRRRRHVDLHLTVHAGQCPQMGGEDDPDHGKVWASTDMTRGRLVTIGSQLSPLSDEPYTWPPVVPKYTPQGSSLSTAMASRSTLT